MLDLWYIPVFKPSIASAPILMPCLPAADRPPSMATGISDWRHRPGNGVALSATRPILTRQRDRHSWSLRPISGLGTISQRAHGLHRSLNVRYRGHLLANGALSTLYPNSFYGHDCKGSCQVTSNGLAQYRWRYQGCESALQWSGAPGTSGMCMIAYAARHQFVSSIPANVPVPLTTSASVASRQGLAPACSTIRPRGTGQS